MNPSASQSRRAATAEISAEHDELLAQLDKPFPESWIPKAPGEQIVGVFLRVESATTAFGPAATMILLVDEPGKEPVERSVWLFYRSLKTALKRLEPVPGELVAIRYNGSQPVKNPTPGKASTFHDYRIAVDRPVLSSRPVDWAAVLEEEGAGVLPGEPDLDGSDIPY